MRKQEKIYQKQKRKNSLNEKNIIILNRFEQHGLQTSGRFEIWEYALKNYDKLKYLAMVFKETDYFTRQYKDYGNNSSNLLLYAFVSGGYFSVIIFLIIYLKMLIILINLN